MSVYLSGKYSREEIAAELHVRLDGNSNFARDIRAKLEVCGYQYNYTTHETTILSGPETAKEKLKDIMVRKIRMSSQIDTVGFAYFINLILNDDIFASMPWGERAKILYRDYHISVTDRTLSSWARYLYNSDFAFADRSGSYWKTYHTGDQKIRIPLEDNDPQISQYNSRRSELLDEYQNMGMSTTEVWGETFKSLWGEFKYCIYRCKTIVLAGFNENDTDTLHEMYELVEEIVRNHGQN